MAGEATAIPGRGGGWRPLGFRADVEGLRAVAVLAVLAYHAGLPWVPGGFVGVDVFFVISGFLITGLLVDELWTSGRVSLPAFYARRARRLLPAVLLVLLAVSLAAALVLGPLEADLVAGDVVAAALYVANFRFALQTTDYLAGDRGDSPVLHLWSLGVEEQFYLLWPLMVVLVGAAVVRHTAGADDEARRRALLGAMALAIGLVGLASLAASLALTRTSQPWAFFGMPTRAWEFALGAAVTLADRRGLVLRGAARTVAAWGGAAVMLGSCAAITPFTAFPGVAALAPALATAALLAAGSPGGAPSGLARAPILLLASAPARFVGQRSYSLYLWHWPVLVLSEAALGDGLSWQHQAVLTLASALPAMLAYSLVERPIHRAPALLASTRRSLALGGATTAAAVLSGLLVVGLAAVLQGPPASALAITPTPVEAMDDLPLVYADDCHLSYEARTNEAACAYGVLDSGRTMVLFGDSHAAQWFPALEILAARHGLRLVSRTKSSCPSIDVTVWHKSFSRRYAECSTWRKATLGQLTGADRPELVVLSNVRPGVLVHPRTGERLGDAEALEAWQEGTERVLRRLLDAGIRVVLIRDTPRPERHVASCVSEHLDAPEKCDVRRDRVPPVREDVAVAGRVPGVEVADLTEAICRPDRCPAVSDGVLVYRDFHHLTATFVKLLAGTLDRSLGPLLAPAIPADG
jgi:peptidoglycan/LPS O-acetylase OafA/YrhL